MNNDIRGMNTDIKEMDTDIKEMDTYIKEMDTDIKEMETDIKEKCCDKEKVTKMSQNYNRNGEVCGSFPYFFQSSKPPQI